MSDSPRPGRLDGKVALITGAAGGIGEAIAHKFAYEGAGGLVLAGLPGDPLGQVAADVLEQYETRVETYAGDLGEQGSAEACVRTALDAFGRLDVLVNNAGAPPKLAPIDEYPAEDFDKLMHSNVKTAFFMTRAAIPHLRETGGNVVSAGSEAGWNGSPQFVPYGPTKAWMHAFMKGVAGEQGPHGVRANCVCPGPVDTSWAHPETGPVGADAQGVAVRSTSFGRRATAEEIANVYAFLASDEASYVTGALWLVDGATTTVHGMPGADADKAAQAQPRGILNLRFQRASDPPDAPGG